MQVTCGDTRNGVGHGVHTAHHDRNVRGEHAAKAEPLAQEQLPTWNRFGRNRLDCPGGDFTGQRVDGGENSHKHCQQIDGIETHGHHCEGDFPPQDWAHAVRGKIFGLKMEARTEQDEKGAAGGKRHPQHLLARRFPECHPGHDPDARHNPPSEPTISRKRSSSERRWGVSS